jgi:protoporphyrinogen IX oxidase
VRADLVVLVLHVFANVVWVGSLLSVVLVLGMVAEDTVPRGRIALRVYRWLAVPGFVGSTVFGVARLALDGRYYLVTTHFMHVKLLLVVAAIGAHHIIGGRVRRAGSKPARFAGLVFGVASFGAIVMAVLKPF